MLCEVNVFTLRPSPLGALNLLQDRQYHLVNLQKRRTYREAIINIIALLVLIEVAAASPEQDAAVIFVAVEAVGVVPTRPGVLPGILE